MDIKHMKQVAKDMKRVSYKIVFDDLMECPLFRGEYDVENGSEDYMNGIWTVMEYIANGVSEDTEIKFENEFVKNMIKSKNGT